MANVIKISGLGKQYTLTHRQGPSYLTLRDAIADSVRRIFRPVERSTREQFWALKDVSLEIRAGERVGIIGRNGAGKSTLLKILSRITAPSRGRVEIEGRVASLLEVGTGFHPELTGRENIFLNGAILGMPRTEIQRKFDSIVAFAEVERFVDTQVKYYSSGMYVRLAFSVAAHVEPDILIVDEVLAVGDAQFQKKCLEKLSWTSEQGRTVLFVSHNMAAIRTLTSRALVLDAGHIVFDGRTEAGVTQYSKMISQEPAGVEEIASGGRHSSIHSARLVDEHAMPIARIGPDELVRLEVALTTDGCAGLSLDAMLFDASKAPVGLFSSAQLHAQNLPVVPGQYSITAALRLPLLASGVYSLDVMTSSNGLQPDHYVHDAVSFEILHSNPGGLDWNFRQIDGYGVAALVLAGELEVRRKVGSTAPLGRHESA